MSSSFNQIIGLGKNYLYQTRTSSVGGATINSVGRWDGSAGSMEMVLGATDSWKGISIIPGKEDGVDDLFVAGQFTYVNDGVSNIPANRIACYNGTTWDTLGGAPLFNNNITALAYDPMNNLLYAASKDTSTVNNKIGVWDGSNWTAIGNSAQFNLNSYPKLTIDSLGRLYLGYSRYLWRYSGGTSGTWEQLDNPAVYADINGTISDLKYNMTNNRVYMTLESSTNNVAYYDIANDQLVNVGSAPLTSARALAFDSSNNLFVAGMGATTYQNSITKFDGSNWIGVYNHRETVGVLDIEIDDNDNIYCYGNSASLIIGLPPYDNSNSEDHWFDFNSLSTVDYGGQSQNTLLVPLDSEPTTTQDWPTTTMSMHNWNSSTTTTQQLESFGAFGDAFDDVDGDGAGAGFSGGFDTGDGAGAGFSGDFDIINGGDFGSGSTTTESPSESTTTMSSPELTTTEPPASESTTTESPIEPTTTASPSESTTTASSIEPTTTASPIEPTTTASPSESTTTEAPASSSTTLPQTTSDESTTAPPTTENPDDQIRSTLIYWQIVLNGFN